MEYDNAVYCHPAYLTSVQSTVRQGFHGGSVGNESTWDAGHPGLIYGSGRSPGEENGNPLQYSCLENLMDRVP